MKMLIALPALRMATATAVHAAAHVPVVVWLILLLLLLLLKVLLVRVVLPRMRSGRRMLRSLRRLADPWFRGHSLPEKQATHTWCTATACMQRKRTPNVCAR